jgi:hypothetical protein
MLFDQSTPKSAAPLMASAGARASQLTNPVYRPQAKIETFGLF